MSRWTRTGPHSSCLVEGGEIIASTASIDGGASWWVSVLQSGSTLGRGTVYDAQQHCERALRALRPAPMPERVDVDAPLTDEAVREACAYALREQRGEGHATGWVPMCRSAWVEIVHIARILRAAGVLVLDPENVAFIHMEALEAIANGRDPGEIA